MDRHPVAVASVAPVLLLVLACFGAAYVAKSFVLPLLVAVLIKFVLSPVVRALHRWRVPPPIGAALTLFAVLATTGYGVSAIIEPAGNWIRDMPRLVENARYKLRSIQQPVEQISDAAKQVDEMTASEEDSEKPVVKVESQSFVQSLLFGAQALVVATVLSTIFLYFLLVTDGSITRKLVELAPRDRQKRHIVAAMKSIEYQTTKYVSAVTVINFGLAILVASTMWLTGMPTPILWGVMAGAFNFVPYLGAVAGVTIVGLVALATFDQVTTALVPPLAYAAINSLEGLLITPAVLGRWHRLSPVAIFIWLTLWSWLWGIAGALLAVPMLMILKIVCDHVPATRPLGLLIGSPKRAPSKGSEVGSGPTLACASGELASE